MKRKYLTPAPLLLGLLLIFGLGGYVAYLFLAGDQKNYSTDLASLKRKFNEERGHVRLLLLLSPT